jgi:hypothetical protein
MELILPLFGLACLSLVSLIASVYLSVQFVLFMLRKHRHQSWSVLWMAGNTFLLLGIGLRASCRLTVPLPPQLLASLVCFAVVPVLWLIAFYRFKRATAIAKTINDPTLNLESEYIIDIRDRNDAWPPPPRR